MFQRYKIQELYDKIEESYEDFKVREELDLMEKYMNSPVEYDWTEEDIIAEYVKIKDKKKVAKIYCITTKQVNEILKSRGM